MVANKSLNFIVRLKGPDAFGRSNEIAIVRVPRALPRVIRIPARAAAESIFVRALQRHPARTWPICSGRELGEFRSSASRAIPSWRWTRKT